MSKKDLIHNLSNEQLIEVYQIASKWSNNFIAIDWVEIPMTKYDDLFMEIFDFRIGRKVKPIFIKNLQDDLRFEMSSRWLEEKEKEILNSKRESLKVHC